MADLGGRGVKVRPNALPDGVPVARTLEQIGAAHGCPAAAVALAWAIRAGNIIAIPESGSPAHVKENAAALTVTLTPQDLQVLDKAFPGPRQGA